MQGPFKNAKRNCLPSWLYTHGMHAWVLLLKLPWYPSHRSQTAQKDPCALSESRKLMKISLASYFLFTIGIPSYEGFRTRRSTTSSFSLGILLYEGFRPRLLKLRDLPKLRLDGPRLATQPPGGEVPEGRSRWGLVESSEKVAQSRFSSHILSTRRKYY